MRTAILFGPVHSRETLPVPKEIPSAWMLRVMYTARVILAELSTSIPAPAPIIMPQPVEMMRTSAGWMPTEILFGPSNSEEAGETRAFPSQLMERGTYTLQDILPARPISIRVPGFSTWPRLIPYRMHTSANWMGRVILFGRNNLLAQTNKVLISMRSR